MEEEEEEGDASNGKGIDRLNHFHRVVRRGEDATSAIMLFGGSRFAVGDDLLEAYVFYGALLVLKMALMAVVTSYHRQANKV